MGQETWASRAVVLALAVIIGSACGSNGASQFSMVGDGGKDATSDPADGGKTVLGVDARLGNADSSGDAGMGPAHGCDVSLFWRNGR